MDKMEQFRVVVDSEQSVLVLRVAGELDMGTAPILRSAFEGFDATTPELVVDLSELTFIDSSGINELVRVQRTLGAGCALVLRAPTQVVRRTLEMTGMDHLVAAAVEQPPLDAAAS